MPRLLPVHTWKAGPPTRVCRQPPVSPPTQPYPFAERVLPCSSTLSPHHNGCERPDSEAGRKTRRCGSPPRTACGWRRLPPAARSIRQRCRASSTSSSKAASPTSRRGTHSQVWRSQRVAVIGSPAVSQPGQPVTGTGPRLTSLTLTAPHTEMLGDREGG